MTQEERLKEIRNWLEKEHELTTRQLADHFNVSFDTARRDVLRLTNTGQAIRIHGGLMDIDRNGVPDFLARNQIQSPIKEKMAQLAKHFVHPGQLDFIGTSTSLRQLCSLITGMNLEVITNSIDNALALMTNPLPSVNLLGGEIKKKERLIYSSSALAEINKIHFNTVFIGTSRVRTDGVYTSTLQDAELISNVVSRASQVVLIAEKYKFTNKSSSPFMSCSLDKIDVVITDTFLPPEFQQLFNPNTQIISVTRRKNHD
ncbi:MAG: DeoR/GlpR family DNA-binding transcription regulator [Candidatus Lactobacillus pullistercoris]|uniref:DeoR/GlpR family DNA-binding transcription regulator n=1 Tax=Candidatus Lactobacillus pullistercoris TaxID=2838636 RepID=A0A9E2KQU6_9LACO|nr:DeoR/GlpR family DNA-binding transcription regulator [Candidatus Lactobacillus pullistercoris]